METKAPSNLERRLVGPLVRAVFSRDRKGGPWPVPGTLRHEPAAFPGNTGARLVGRWFPHDRPRGAVVLAHPDRRYAQHWFVRTGWVHFLHRAGFEVLTFDLAGYGESRGGATYYHEDVEAAARWAHREAGGLPLHLVGVSMGAFAAANAAPRLTFLDGLVLESPYPNFNAWYGKGPGLVAMRAFDALFPRTSAAIQADRNVARAHARRILVAAPERDRVTPAHLSRAVADAAPRDRTRYLELPGLDHLEPFGASATYRAAVLETLGARAEEAAALAAIPVAATHPRPQAAGTAPVAVGAGAPGQAG